MWRPILVAVLAAGLLTSCFGSDPRLTDSGKGKPVVSVDFPGQVAPGSVHDAVLEVSNPGPGDMDIVAVAFALVGPSAGQRDFPEALVGLGSDGRNRAVQDVSPQPRGVAEDGVVYTFDGLGEGESMTITFSLEAPQATGPAANSIQVYDGREIDRAAGVRLETLVER